jgi:hypothetical protein
MSFGDFENYLKGTGKDQLSLRHNWVYLQIFATYGVRLPHTKETIEAHLHLKPEQAATFSWLPDFTDSLVKLNNSGDFFFKQIFEPMIMLGSSLKSYAHDASGPDSIFLFIKSIVLPGKGQDLDTALNMLKDLIKDASDNAEKAATINEKLSSYQTQLTAIQTKLAATKTKIDTEDGSSEATIDKLSGGPEITGSLKQLRALRAADNAEFHHDIDVAFTSITYCWCTLIGIVASMVVAAKYGKMAGEMKEKVINLDAQIKTASDALSIAIKTHTTTDLAETSINDLQRHLELAITKTSAVEKGWKTAVNDLQFISKKVQKTLHPDSPTSDKLAAINTITHYLTIAAKKWSEIKPLVDQMTLNPVINVAHEDLDLAGLHNLIEQQIG